MDNQGKSFSGKGKSKGKALRWQDSWSFKKQSRGSEVNKHLEQHNELD